MLKLPHEFYNRNVVEVAKDLIGKKLICGEFQGVITETEAYRGYDDQASHAFRGITKRSEVMFGPPGYTYVYLIYGMNYCLNIVTEGIGQAGAVLIRGLKSSSTHLNGPGKACRYLGITNKHNRLNLIQNDYIYLTESIKNPKFLTTPRIGIKKDTEKLWRFIISEAVPDSVFINK